MAVEHLGGFAAGLVVGAHGDEADAPGRHALGPDDPRLVMAGLDDRRDQTRNADAVAAHERSDSLTIVAGDLEPHRGGIFVAEIEDVADFDPAPGAAPVLGDLAPQRLVVSLVGGRVGRAHAVEESMEVLLVAVIDIGLLPIDLLELGIVEDFALARRGENDELVAEITTDRP